MKVIFTKDINKYYKGDLVDVASGYARNFLIPSGYAILATKENLQKRDKLLKEAQKEKESQEKKWQELISKIQSLTLAFPLKTGPKGVFGSVTTKDILSSLQDKGIDLEKHQFVLEHPIKELGTFEIPIKFSSDHQTNLKLEIIEENVAKKS